MGIKESNLILITTETQLKKPAYMQHLDIVCICVISTRGRNLNAQE